MFNVTDSVIFDYFIINPYNIYITQAGFTGTNLISAHLLAPILLTKILPTHIWSLAFFFCIFYLTTIFLLAASTIPLVFSFTDRNFKNTINYVHITAWSMYKFMSTPIMIMFLLTFSWVSLTVNMWFGQIVMSTMQRNLTLLCVSSFGLVYYIYNTNIIYNTKDVYDFIITLFNTLIWTFLLFYSNNLFVVIFFIEILTGLTTLILITSAFSSTYNYQVWNFSKSLYFNSILPKSTLDTLIFFFECR